MRCQHHSSGIHSLDPAAAFTGKGNEWEQHGTVPSTRVHFLERHPAASIPAGSCGERICLGLWDAAVDGEHHSPAAPAIKAFPHPLRSFGPRNPPARQILFACSPGEGVCCWVSLVITFAVWWQQAVEHHVQRCKGYLPRGAHRACEVPGSQGAADAPRALCQSPVSVLVPRCPPCSARFGHRTSSVSHPEDAGCSVLTFTPPRLRPGEQE